MTDPYLDWCEKNYQRLKEHPNYFVVVDIKKDTILFGADTRDELSVKYRQLPRSERVGLYTTHTFKDPPPSNSLIEDKNRWIQKAKALLFDCNFCVDSPSIRDEIEELLEESGGYDYRIESSKTPLRWKGQK